MTKRVYSELFQFIVNKINIELSTNKKPRHKFIGVLDIFGFESFEVNSFEQLCINFCNEKLQFHFNEHIFKMEQTLYKAEGITIPSSSFVDNQPTLDLLELKMTGVFAMMDEEINVPKGSDEGFLSKVFKQHEKKHPNMIKPGVKDCKDSQKNFGILHYAGPVFYNVTGFLEKNKDQLSADLQNVLKASAMGLVQSLFKDVDTAAGGKPKAKLTVGAQFKNQLNELVATLNSTFPHFVRCMKSNDKKSGNIFTAGRMLDQLKYAGLVEVCRIRKLGFPVRRTFQEFYKRFKPIELTCMNLDALLKVLSDRKILKQGEWAKGFTKVFYRTAQAGELELAREKAFLKVAVKVQKVARGILFRKRYKRCKQIIVNLREAIKKRSDTALTDALNMCGELPYAGTHMKLVAEAKGLHARIKEEAKVLKLLENAMAIKEVNGIKSAIEAAQSMKPAFTPPLLAEAQALVQKIESEQAAKTALSTAVASRDLKQLADAIAKANAIKLVCNELQQAVSLKARIEEENSVISKLNDAAKAKNVDAMNDLMSKCAELGITNRPEVAAHKKLHEQLAEEARKRAEKDGKAAEAAKKQKEALEAAGKKREAAMAAAESKLTEAMNNGDMNRVNALLNDAMQLGLASEVVKQAQQFLKTQDTSTGVQSQLEACVKVLKVKADTGITEQDLLPLRNAITKARQANLPELQKSLKEAEEAHILYQKHVTAAAGLKAALNSKDRLQLRRALDEAENLDLQIEIMTSAKEILRELEIAYRAQKAAGDIVENVEPYDAAEEARKARQEVAKQARFDVKNFPNLRTADDYARGAILNKAKVKEQFLVFQNSVVPKSLLDLNKENNKLAMQIHKDLLGYMGDKQMPFPAMLAQDILRKGYEYKPIRDEIYMQIIKQLTQNPRPESVAKGWQIMCMCVGTFPPSFDFENFLLHYIIEKRDKGRGAVVDYARYCLRTLEAMLSNGDGTGFVPSVEEILAYKERPPILATIHLVDGNVITEDLPITPDLNVGKVLEMCSGWLDLKDSRVDSLGMFVYDCGETEDAASMDESYKNAPYRDLIRTPRPLRNDDYMGDIIVQRARQRRKFKFVIKRKIFLPQHNGRGSDPFYERLNYLQAEDETIIQGNIDINDEEKVVALAGISMAVAFGEEMGGTVEELVAANVQDFIPPAWREKKSPDAWANLILQTRDSLVSSDPEDLQDQFLQIVQESPLYGTHWFYVYKVDTPPSVAVPPAVKSLPREIMLGFNAEGMHVYSLSRQLLVSFPYADIYRWGGSSSQFSLIMADASLADSFEFVIITGQAADMAAIILDHIRAIMSEQEAAEAEG